MTRPPSQAVALLEVLRRAHDALRAGNLERAEGLVGDALRLVPVATDQELDGCDSLLDDLARGFAASLEA